MSMSRALETIRNGGCLVYPTETLYALGGAADSAIAAARIYLLKGRDPAKPLPLIISGTDQLPLVTENAPADLCRLAELFWPGPLSVLVPAHPELPPAVSDERGLTSVRATPHPLAAKLCRESGSPLIATSANISGRPAVADLDNLDRELAERVDCILGDGPPPAGGAPSTVVEPLGGGVLVVHREGAVTVNALRDAGFEVRST